MRTSRRQFGIMGNVNAPGVWSSGRLRSASTIAGRSRIVAARRAASFRGLGGGVSKAG
jgi:hypothetical protein